MITDFSKKQKMKFSAEKVALQATGILFFVIILVLIFADIKIYQKKQEVAVQIATLQKQIQDIKNSSQTLKDEIANSNNTDYLEKIAYEQLGEQKPGEKEVIFVAPKEKPKTVVQPQNFWDVKTFSAWFSGAWAWIKSKF